MRCCSQFDDYIVLQTVTNSLDSELALFDQILSPAQLSADSQTESSSGPSILTESVKNAYSKCEDMVDFGPVYRCLHIHSVLRERAEFERYYCSQRRKQWQLSLSLSPKEQVLVLNLLSKIFN